MSDTMTVRADTPTTLEHPNLAAVARTGEIITSGFALPRRVAVVVGSLVEAWISLVNTTRSVPR